MQTTCSNSQIASRRSRLRPGRKAVGSLQSEGITVALTQMGEVQTVRLHGHRRAYLKVGSGPAILLIHGIGSRHETWLPVISTLAQKYTVIAPDLLGHGQSAKPRADYSIAGYANGMRDLLSYLAIDSATVVGHSLGGGVAMQFAYQYPQRTDRIVLVGSGGLGPEVNPLITLCTVPGSGAGLAMLGTKPVRAPGTKLLKKLHTTNFPWTADLVQLSTVYDGLNTRESRAAFRQVLRAIVDWRGQILTMRDRAYLAEFLPSMVIWGQRDTVIPVKHAQVAHSLFRGSRLEIFDECGHFPHAEEPERFADVLIDFMETSPVGRFDSRRWNLALKRGPRGYEMLPDQDELISVHRS
jgi:pimeloyl-ACP methyl ester carboxylesterase